MFEKKIIGVPDDKDVLTQLNEAILDTQMLLVGCMKKGSREIIGLNEVEILYPEKGDPYEVINNF